MANHLSDLCKCGHDLGQHNECEDNPPALIARDAYILADAMLEARKK